MRGKLNRQKPSNIDEEKGKNQQYVLNCIWLLIKKFSPSL